MNGIAVKGKTKLFCGMLMLASTGYAAANPAIAKSVPAHEFVEPAANSSDDAKPVLTWAINPGPPFHIVSGPLKGEGFCDALVDSLTLLLPNYRHNKVVVPQGRVLELLSAPDSQMCFPCMIKRQEPPKGVQYTQSTHQFSRHVLITRASLLNATEPVSLSTLLDSGKYRYGYPQGRRYGVLDPLLEAYKTEHPDLVLARSGPGEADSVLSLIEIGRIDFTVDYPMVLKYHQLVSQKDALVPLKMLPIAENQQITPQQAVGCADNVWGRQVISQINQQIPALQISSNFIQAKKFWLGEQQANSSQTGQQQP